MKVVLARVLASLPLLFAATLGAFLLVRLSPGDPAYLILSENPTPAELAQAHHRLGLDQPMPIQYWHWLTSAMHGDFGQSYHLQQSVSGLISDRLPVTLSLALLAVLISVALASVFGTIAGAYEGSLADRLITGAASIGLAMPGFWVGVMLAVFFAVRLGWLPATGYVPITQDPFGWFEHMLLPAVTLALHSSAELTRQLRASMSDVMHRDYIRAAEAKGLPWGVILAKHAFRNAAIPVVTLLGLQLIALLGGAVIVEAVFALPGFGSLVINAAVNRDMPVLQGVVVVVAVIALLINLLVDLSYRFLNPRVRVT
jgi:peptide/nickel transport system permease protein